MFPRSGRTFRKCAVAVQDVHSQGEVIACLEKGLIREAEQQAGVHVIKDECKKAIMRVAELSSDDFHLDRYLYLSCRDDRERFCENVRAAWVRVWVPAWYRVWGPSSDWPRLCCRFWRGRGGSTSVSSTTSLRRPCRSG